MPIFSSQLGKIESQNTEQSIKVMANHLRKIQEELEYRLMHLDSSNVSDIDASQTNVLVGGKPIQNVLQDNSGNYSSLEQTVNGLSSVVADQAGSISTLQQTANTLKSQVSNLTLDMSSLEQTSSSILATVYNMQEDVGHMLKLDANGVYIVDNNGKQVTIQSGQINAEGLTVNAANITGTLNASYLTMKGLFKILVGSSIYGWIGGTDTGETAGAALTGPSTMNGVFATNTGAQLTYNVGTHKIWVDKNGCWSNVEMDVYSDRRLKNNISYDLEAEAQMFMRLRPCTYRLNSDGKEKTRWGFIAQEVIEGAEYAGLDPEKLAVVNSSDGMYGLAYSNFTALNTYMIQKLMQRVAALEEANA